MTNFLTDSFLPESRKRLPALSSQAPELWASDHVVRISALSLSQFSKYQFHFPPEISPVCVKCHSFLSDLNIFMLQLRQEAIIVIIIPLLKIIPCTNDQSIIIATLKLQITICLHPCHRQRWSQHSRQTVSRESSLVLVLHLWLVWDVWVCLSKFLASLLSWCLSWQLSFPGPGLVIVMAAPSLIISSSASVLSILLAINQVTWSWSPGLKYSMPRWFWIRVQQFYLCPPLASSARAWCTFHNPARSSDKFLFSFCGFHLFKSLQTYISVWNWHQNKYQHSLHLSYKFSVILYCVNTLS